MVKPVGLVTPIAAKVFRTGRQTLYLADDGYWVRLRNRANDSWVPVSPAKAIVWKGILK